MLRHWLRVVLACCLGVFALLWADGAWAASFEVSPIRLALSQTSPSALLKVQNQSADPLRFQVTAFAWKQGPGGEMVLDPTDELVVFPTIFALKPGEARNIRVGSTAPLGGVEKTYRLIVEELPLRNAPGVNAVNVLTRMSVPVFRSPAGSASAPGIEALSVQNDDVAFALRNRGNAFFFVRHVRLTGLSRDGKTVFTRELPGWYILAGGYRAYAAALPPEACDATRLVVHVETETTNLEASIELPPRACRR
jgi:fimbrial chaperone protein